MTTLLRVLCVAALCVPLTPLASAQQRTLTIPDTQRATTAQDGVQAETIDSEASVILDARPAAPAASDLVDLLTGTQLASTGPIFNSVDTSADPGGDESIIFLPPAAVMETTFGYTGRDGATFLYDDFVVPNGKGWNIARFALYAYQTGAIGATNNTSINGVRVTVYPDAGNVPDFTSPIFPCGTTADSTGGLVTPASVTATDVYRVTNDPTSSNGTGMSTLRQIQRVEAATNGTCKLSGGRYWVEFTFTGTSTSGPFVPTVPGANGNTCYGGNGLQLTIDGFFILQNGFCNVTFPMNVIGKEQSSTGPANLAQNSGQYVVRDTTSFTENFQVPYRVCNKLSNPISGATRYRVFRGNNQVAGGSLVSGTVPANTCVNLQYRQVIPLAGAPDGNYRYCVQAAATPSGPTVAESCAPLTIITPVGFDFDHTPSLRPIGSDDWAVTDLTPWPSPEGTLSAAATAAPGQLSVFPNPFARETSVAFSLNESAEVRLAVYDVLGREVAVLVDGQMDAGQHTATFEAQGLASGTYIYRLVVGDAVQSGRITLMK